MIAFTFSTKKIVWIPVLVIFVAGLCIPQRFYNPVARADKRSYHPQSFWYYPWGRSGTHKGVDIFAPAGTVVRSSTGGIVIFAGIIGVGGNVILVLGPKWRLHYYAHLKSINTNVLSWTSIGERIGTVGATGNAQGKSPHLHYAIITLIPYIWRADRDRQGWKKMFYLNPIDYL